jgi:hypothetical protein
MTNYQDPKVTTPIQGKRSVGKWIGIAVVVIVALLLLAWLMGAFSNYDTATAPVITQEPAATTATQTPPAVTQEPAAGTRTTAPTTTVAPAESTTEPIEPAD